MSLSIADRWLSHVGATTADMFFNEPVTLGRGSLRTTNVKASWIKAGAEVQVAPRGQVLTSIVDREWQVLKSLYAFSGLATEPQTADRVTDEAGRTWEAMKAGKDSVSNETPDGLYWLIRTKEITA